MTDLLFGYNSEHFTDVYQAGSTRVMYLTMTGISKVTNKTVTTVVTSPTGVVKEFSARTVN